MKNTKFIAILFAGLLTASEAIAGDYYHGHGYMMPSWDMTEMDTDGSGSLSFDEYSDAHKKGLRGGFDMIDENKDGEIADDEWQNFLEVHGMTTNS